MPKHLRYHKLIICTYIASEKANCCWTNRVNHILPHYQCCIGHCQAFCKAYCHTTNEEHYMNKFNQASVAKKKHNMKQVCLVRDILIFDITIREPFKNWHSYHNDIWVQPESLTRGSGCQILKGSSQFLEMSCLVHLNLCLPTSHGPHTVHTTPQSLAKYLKFNILSKTMIGAVTPLCNANAN
jgi:hypothetical protein